MLQPGRHLSQMTGGSPLANHEVSPQLLSLAGIAHRCAQETDLFFRRQSYDPRYCFELFRRAFLHRNQRAWELVYAQYRPLVAGWVERHAAFPATGEETQYFVNRAFEKMWSAVSPDGFDRFPDLRSLLSYLQMCVHSAIVDEVRSAERLAVDVDVDVSAATNRAGSPSVEDQALTQAQREELWQFVNERLNDEKERLVVYGSFALALKPRQLYAELGHAFSDVSEIYRIKQNVLARLRRDPELKKLLGEDA
ncbi:MAG: sigma-70 family RNA polymerase sigma factor [Chloroflexi bacterium]|nr:MAG: sigma-70 family RNA polymerase sigma factor [Chloroflexota bacterium]